MLRRTEVRTVPRSKLKCGCEVMSEASHLRQQAVLQMSNREGFMETSRRSIRGAFQGRIAQRAGNSRGGTHREQGPSLWADGGGSQAQNCTVHSCSPDQGSTVPMSNDLPILLVTDHN